MARGQARILLVDDEQAVQTLLTYPLRKEGYDVVAAIDGQEALDRFAEQRFDLVVLDIMLPKLDGIEVCRRMRTRSQVPIIMLTAKGDEIDKVVGLEMGADDYITKPFSVREFRSRVKAALRRGGMAAGGPVGEEPIRAGELQIDPLQHLVLAEGLVDAPEAERGPLHHRRPPVASCRRRSRATSQSVSRASGMVRRMNRMAVTR